MRAQAIAVALITLWLWGVATARAQTRGDEAIGETERQAIESTLLRYEKALNASDVEAVLKLYAPDGVFMPSGAPTAVGTEQLRGAYQHVFATIKLAIKFSIDEVVQDGDFAFARTVSRGTVTVLADDVTAPEENRELFVLQRLDGEWKITRYMFNKMS